MQRRWFCAVLFLMMFTQNAASDDLTPAAPAVLAGAMDVQPPATEAAHSTPSAAQAFAELSSLVGAWRGRFPDGREHTVTYRLTAGGTVLVETWALAPGRESMTLYHLDGDALLATHYCPQGNQPRLRLVAGKQADRLSFELKDGSNLYVPGKWHQHAMWIEVKSKDAFTRSETYFPNGSETAQQAESEIEEGAAIEYTRVDADNAGH